MSKNSKPYIDQHDFHRLKIISENLYSRYPNDWLAKFWNGRDKIVVLGAIAMGFLIIGTSLPLWLAFMPLIIVSIVFQHLPHLLWKRKIRSPRWAHPKVFLSQGEIDEINLIVQRLKPVQRAAMSQYLPVRTGDTFWIIWASAQQFSAGNAHIEEEYKISLKYFLLNICSLIFSSIALFLMLQILFFVFGFNFSQWALTQVESQFLRSIIQFLTIPTLQRLE